MKLNVHLLQEFDKKFVKSLDRKTHDNIVLTYGKELPSPSEYQILIAGRPERKHLIASPNLKTLIIPWAGLPEQTRTLLLEYPDITVHNIHHNAAPAAEMAITLMLAACKDLVPIDRALRNNDWRPRYRSDRALLLEGKTALILGYGAIGKRIAAICHSLGMKVNAIRRMDTGLNDRYVNLYSISDLHRLLKVANVVFVSLPLTPETQGIIGSKELDILPRGTALVNVARGPIIKEKSLYDALRANHIKAGLDVWYEYPKKENRSNTHPSKYPFHKLDNVVMTTHLAGHADDTEKLRLSALAELLNLAAEDKILPSRVNLSLGY